MSTQKRYLVVGVSRGIGKHIVDQLINEGHSVIGISRTAVDGLDHHFCLDVTHDALPAIADSLDGFVFCPGSIVLKSIRSVSAEDIRKEMDLNIISAVRVLQHVLPNLQQSAQAAVVFFSTVAVQTGMPYHAVVAMAKGAVEGLTRSLAAELAPKIRVNCIAPSLTDTSLAARLLDTDAKRQGAAERHPLKTVGTPQDIAAMACFLLSEKAAFMSGQIVKMDGGISSVKL
jgi:NAD(P)-dependent dehydrogenase (short-subunit alcohol dehydrogenase family)